MRPKRLHSFTTFFFKNRYALLIILLYLLVFVISMYLIKAGFVHETSAANLFFKLTFPLMAFGVIMTGVLSLVVPNIADNTNYRILEYVIAYYVVSGIAGVVWLFGSYTPGFFDTFRIIYSFMGFALAWAIMFVSAGSLLIMETMMNFLQDLLESWRNNRN